ncbi:phage tail protein [Actinoplanes sp. M2I2]|uniref:phage tail protein n=1 Tax=Actinoplanes sp. M2I2 TaxID=1734444 RepID=UPI0020224BC8|nr:phage tail protein [Actinoplanes sp. M2I2]
MPERPVSAVLTCDQWVRGRHEDTAVEAVPPGTPYPVALTLTWQDADPAPWSEAGGPVPRGSAVDRLCRVYRLDRRSVARLAVGDVRDGLDYARMPAEVTVIGADPGPALPGAEFSPRPGVPVMEGAGIAVDADDRLFLADGGRREITVLDLWSRRLLRRIPVASSGHPARTPIGLAARNRDVVAVVAGPPGLLSVSARRELAELPAPDGAAALPAGAAPRRVAITVSGEVVTLWAGAGGQAWLVAGGRAPLAVDGARDLVVSDDEDLVVLAPGRADDGGQAPLHRVLVTATGWVRTQPLDARGYDGRGLVALAGGRIGYWSASGFRLAVAGRVRYAPAGTWLSYRFDSGVAGNRWGRVFVDACVPAGTDLRVATITTDDEYETGLAPRPPDPAHCRPDPATAGPALPPAALTATGPLHRRGDEPAPWWRLPPGTGVLEAPVAAPPGRYLWLALRLTGDHRRTPSVRALRIERQAHTLSRRLPAVVVGDGEQAAFLDRFLGLFDGLLQDLQVRSERRDLLVDPAVTPVEALPWLASFLGLVLDDRWAEPARRRLIAEVNGLYRRRGTLGAIRRYLEIYLAGDRALDDRARTPAPVLVEHYRLRGLGPDLGADPVGSGRSVLGAGLRVGAPYPDGEVARPGLDSSAHRFTVVVPRPLSAEQTAVVRQILDTERPAHTAYELCTVDSGIRVGRGFHLDLTSVIGPTGGLRPAVLGAGNADRDLLLGGPATGIAVEGARLGAGARIG